MENRVLASGDPSAFPEYTNPDSSGSSVRDGGDRMDPADCRFYQCGDILYHLFLRGKNVRAGEGFLPKSIKKEKHSFRLEFFSFLSSQMKSEAIFFSSWNNR